jgi:GMP synthase (glutamine-hydrolysing)
MDTILILDFGGQYCHLIARRVREFGVYAEVVPADISAKTIQKNTAIRGIILSGGARSVYGKDAPKFDASLFDLGVPILGICYGHQLIAHTLGGKVVEGAAGEYGLTTCDIINTTTIFKRFGRKGSVWMNHRDVVRSMPDGFVVTARTEYSPVTAFEHPGKHIYGVQFHPEVSHTAKGDVLLKNFVITVCNAKKGWKSERIVDSLITEAGGSIGEDRAIIGLSGGIDSSVAAAIVGKAIGKQLTAVYVDTGMMREGETDLIREMFRESDLRLKIIKAGPRFFKALKGVTSPERKRKIIGKLFVDIFTEEAKKEHARFLVQGTIYSDRIESGGTKHASNIKSHHNVGGLPKNLKLKLYEPLRDLYKDEVRAIAKEMALPEKIASQQVFPGPGLAIRIIGEVTPARTKIVRRAGAIIEEELRNTSHWEHIWMSFAVLLPIKSVGVQGDERSYKHPVVVRIVESRDAMTATFAKIPFEILERISTRITNEIREVNRVVYDITHKPPATMEWE